MKVLLTGGSGFLGRGIIKHWPENEYIVYSRDEYKQDMARRVLGNPQNVSWVLGDVLDVNHLHYAMRDADLVIHTAAIKYIPEAEFNVRECVRVNVDGSRNVIDAAIKAGVSRVVGISTDKAVEPVNVYGMTKALMERMFVEANQFGDGKTTFTCTRYGNVVGSTGSVLTVFKDQALFTGKITVTDPDMTRFWQSIKASVELIKLAAQADPGNIIIPSGESSTMGILASYFAGLKEPAAEIEYIGVRPGEKMHEALVGQYESLRTYVHNKFSKYYILPPVGSETRNAAWTLSSSNPTRFVTHADLDDMLQQAAEIGY